MEETRKYEPRICAECGELITEYVIEKYESRIEDENDNVLGIVETESASCPHCGEYIFLPEIEKENNKKFSLKEKEIFNSLSYLDIQKLPRRYNIPREYFEIVLGIKKIHTTDDGKIEPFNIWEGDPMNYEEDSAIHAVYENPDYYIELLKAKKDELPEDIYNKSMERAVGLSEKKK